jgi:hypothetical protein
MNCPFCAKSFATKYTLAKHINSNKACNLAKTIHDEEQKRVDSEIERKQQEIHNLIQKYETEIREMKTAYETRIAIQENDLRGKEKQIEDLKVIVDKAIAKTGNVTNIKNSNVNVMNILSEKYEGRTEHDFVLEVAREKFEPYFWDGQRGLANFCVDHIIRTKDGKMILCCTDPTRKRFKYLDAQGDMKEDIEARLFTEKMSIPIAIVCEEVYEKIRAEIDDSMKRDMADLKFLELIGFKNSSTNTEYRQELCTLLNV